MEHRSGFIIIIIKILYAINIPYAIHTPYANTTNIPYAINKLTNHAGVHKR